jgi:hypothetical protein
MILIHKTTEPTSKTESPFSHTHLHHIPYIPKFDLWGIDSFGTFFGWLFVRAFDRLQEWVQTDRQGEKLIAFGLYREEEEEEGDWAGVEGNGIFSMEK